MAMPRAAAAHRAELEAAEVEHVERDLVALADLAEQVRRPAPSRPAGSAASSTSRAGPACALPCRSLTPGNARSTMNAVNCSPSTLAKTMKTSAKPPLVIHIFSPLSTKLPSGCRMRSRLRAERVGTGAGLAEAVGADAVSPAHEPRQILLLLLLGAEQMIGRDREVRLRAERRRERRVAADTARRRRAMTTLSRSTPP